MPEPRQIQDTSEIENRAPLSGRDALAALRTQVEGVTAEQRERHVQNLREYLDRISATPEQRRQALEGLPQDFHTILDIQSAQSRSIDNTYRLGKTFLETANRNPERGNIRFRVVFENEIHNATIGLGHILPPNVRRVAVTDLHGNVRIGERRADPRVGYFDGQGYIPVFNGYTVDVLTTVADNDQQVTQSRNEERNYFQNLLQIQQQESRAGLSAEVEATRRGETPPATLAESPQYREIIRKFTQAEIQLPEETLIYAERDLRDMQEHTNLVEMLDANTLEIFQLATFGGRIGNTEIKPPTHEGYDIRFKDIPLFHQFAMRLRDPIFSRTIVSILERERHERESDNCTFENVYELIENAYVAQELAAPEQAATPATTRQHVRTEYEIDARLSQGGRERFMAYVRGPALGLSGNLEGIIAEKPATRFDFERWYRETNAPSGEFGYFYRLFQSITKQESGGNYYALGRPIEENYNGGRALGRYQIMTSINRPENNNWENWSRRIADHILIPTPFNQDRVAFTQLVTYYKNFRNQGNSNELSARMVAAMWYRGRSGAHNNDYRSEKMRLKNEPSVRQYCDQVVARMARMSG